MIRRVTITPKFDYKHIKHTTLDSGQRDFQVHARLMGMNLAQLNRSYINNNCKRAGSTGNLEKNIEYKEISTTGGIQWGIGDMSVLNAQAKYWFAINYGKKITGEPFIPGGGNYRPVQFEDGPADPTKRGIGNSKAIAWKRIEGPNERKPSVVRPMNFIEYGYRMLIAHTEKLVARWVNKKV